MDAAEEQKLLGAITTRLSVRHNDIPVPLVNEVVDSAYHRFDGVPIRDFVPVLVERRAAASLAMLSQE